MLDNIIKIFESESESDIRFILNAYIPQLSNQEIKMLGKHLIKLKWTGGTERSEGKIIDPPYIFNQKIISITSRNEYRFYTTRELYNEVNAR